MYFITSNKNKVKEFKSFIGINIKQISIDIKEIQSFKVEDVVVDKVKKAFQIVKKPIFVEDSGLYINCLNGLPATFIKYFLKTIGNDGIYNIVSNYNDKTAIAKTSIAFYDGKVLKVFSGITKGIITKPRGNNGFGWDCIFIPEGSNKTFAEMSLEEKNKFSMRIKALMKLKRFINNYNIL